MNTVIREFYQHITTGNIANAESAIAKAESLNAPISVITSMRDILAFLDKDCEKNLQTIASEEYRNSRIYRRTNETAPRSSFLKCPLVSIIIVSYNSGRELGKLLPTISQQAYKNIELIVVDNGSDDSKEIIHGWSQNSGIQSCYIQNTQNLGFAEANNIGASRSKGEYLLLLNPDTRLDPYSIKELIKAICNDSEHAIVACPKIYFDREFFSVTIDRMQTTMALDRLFLTQGLEYKKIFLRAGSLSRDGTRIYPNSDGQIGLELPSPIRNEVIRFRVLSLRHQDQGNAYNGAGDDPTSANKPLRISIADLLCSAIIHADTDIHEIRSSISLSAVSRRIINNAGSGFNEAGMPFDIGYAEEDSAKFMSTAHVDAFCGCCVLVHRLVWISRKLFLKHFFAYFEDSELSYWLLSHNYQLLYCPNSIVYHRHSETTQEKSPEWTYLVERSRAIFKLIIGKTKYASFAIKTIQGLESSQASLSLRSSVEATCSFSTYEELTKELKRPVQTVAIYNAYWSSRGGGERHALEIAELISGWDGYEVYLISEKPFSIDQLEDYFEINLSRCLPLQLDKVTTLVTGFFDVFINSTYQSMLESRARQSYYLVSFPTIRMPEQMINGYTFLHNSEFTRSWAYQYWGKHRNQVIYPILGFKPIDSLDHEKEKLIISIGRFNLTGHCKNQDQIISAFVEALNKGLLDPDWRLVVAGSVDPADESSVRHYKNCLELARDYPITVIADAEYQEIASFYQKAFAYIHAAGIDIHPDTNPEMCEHFGIAVFQSIIYRCIPIVHCSGGPLEIAKLDHRSLSYSDIHELLLRLQAVNQMFETRSDALDSISGNCFRIKDLIANQQSRLQAAIQEKLKSSEFSTRTFGAEIN